MVIAHYNATKLSKIKAPARDGYIGNTFAAFLIESPGSVVAKRLVGPDKSVSNKPFSKFCVKIVPDQDENCQSRGILF
jgi:hypothetical protein